MSSGDLLLLSELFLAQLLRDLECRNSPFEFVSFFFPSGCFFFGKIVMISKRESELFRRSFPRTTNQARQAPASCCFMTSIYGMREKARTYGTLEGMRSWRSETWDEYLRSKVLGNSIYTNSEAFNRPFARWRSMTRVTTTTRTLCQYPCANSRGHWQSILVSYNYPTSSWKLPRTGNELKLSEDNVLKSGGGGMEAVNTNYVILPNLTRNCLGGGGGGGGGKK